ncbi:MAG: DUF2062 domain-containing protein [Lysobacteraceae bacterium]
MTHEIDRHRRELARRRRFARKLLRPLPRRANVARYPVIKWFAGHAQRRPFLWSFKREHVIPAIYGGAILAFLPLFGFQFLAAFGAALLLRCNLTITVGLQFITNPFTIVPIYGFTAWIGTVVMRTLGLGGDLGLLMGGANALVVGGIVVGAAVALLIDIVWRLAAWEARRFKARLEEAHRVERRKSGNG